MSNNNKRLVRGSDRMISGVCSGLADYFGCDVTIIRVAFAILVLTGTIGLWVYLLLLILMPDR